MCDLGSRSPTRQARSLPRSAPFPRPQDGGHGQAWGQLTWGGVPQGEQPRQINGPLKRVWRVVDAPAGAAARGPVAWESLAAQALREESAAAAAEAAAAEEAAAPAAEQPADAST